MSLLSRLSDIDTRIYSNDGLKCVWTAIRIKIFLVLLSIDNLYLYHFLSLTLSSAPSAPPHVNQKQSFFVIEVNELTQLICQDE